MLYVLFFSLIAIFTSFEAVYLSNDKDMSGSYFMPLGLSLLNILLWIVLVITNRSFVSMLNKRFGEAEFNGPKCKLLIFLIVFSLSFFIRGAWDLVMSIQPIEFDNNLEKAIVIFLIYFITEWVPIFVIYSTHLWAFNTLLQREKRRAKSMDKGQVVLTSSGKSDGNDDGPSASK